MYTFPHAVLPGHVDHSLLSTKENGNVLPLCNLIFIACGHASLGLVGCVQEVLQLNASHLSFIPITHVYMYMYCNWSLLRLM